MARVTLLALAGVLSIGTHFPPCFTSISRIGWISQRVARVAWTEGAAALSEVRSAARTWAASSDAAQNVIRQTRQLGATVRYGSRLGTGAGRAYFWSGHTAGVGGEALARQIATSRGAATLEVLLEERAIGLPPWDPADPEVVAAWKDVATEYAQYARGEVRAVVGKTLRPQNVWEGAEFPALKANPRVTKIITIDPATGVETVVFKR